MYHSGIALAGCCYDVYLKFKMGNECRKTSELHLAQEYSSIQPQSHPAFGNIFYLRCDRSKVEKAVKQIPCPN